MAKAGNSGEKAEEKAVKKAVKKAEFQAYRKKLEVALLNYHLNSEFYKRIENNINGMANDMSKFLDRSKNATCAKEAHTNSMLLFISIINSKQPPNNEILKYLHKNMGLSNITEYDFKKMLEDFKKK